MSQTGKRLLCPGSGPHSPCSTLVLPLHPEVGSTAAQALSLGSPSGRGRGVGSTWSGAALVRQGGLWGHRPTQRSSPPGRGALLSSCLGSPGHCPMQPPNCPPTLLLQTPFLHPFDFVQSFLQISLPVQDPIEHPLHSSVVPSLICAGPGPVASVTPHPSCSELLPPTLLLPCSIVWSPPPITHTPLFQSIDLKWAFQQCPTFLLFIWRTPFPLSKRTISFFLSPPIIHLQVHRSPHPTPNTYLPQLSSVPIPSCQLEELALFTSKPSSLLSPLQTLSALDELRVPSRPSSSLPNCSHQHPDVLLCYVSSLTLPLFTPHPHQAVPLLSFPS